MERWTSESRCGRVLVSQSIGTLFPATSAPSLATGLEESDSPDCRSDNAERDSHPQNDQHICARDGERETKIADDVFRWELGSFARHAVPHAFLPALGEITRAAGIRSGCDEFLLPRL
jgi:hypothetical protein